MPAHFIGWYLKVGSSLLDRTPGFRPTLSSGLFSSHAVGGAHSAGRGGLLGSGPQPDLTCPGHHSTQQRARETDPRGLRSLGGRSPELVAAALGLGHA